MIFSTDTASASFSPQCALLDHSFGVSCLAFSPDSRWLCSVGDCQDGFVHLWYIEDVANTKLHASNRCTAGIRGLSWLGGSIVTVGTRHVKIWRPHHKFGVSSTKQNLEQGLVEPSTALSPRPRPLVGRNCILGPLADATFTCIYPISSSLAVICTEKGGICFLKEESQTSTVVLIISAPFGISCCAFEHEKQQLWVGGAEGENRVYLLSQYISPPGSSMDKYIPTNPQLLSTYASGLVAGGVISRSLVTITEDHAISVCHSIFDNDADASGVEERTSTSHRCAVVGVRILTEGHEATPKFLTWSVDGVIKIWSLDGLLRHTQHIELENRPTLGYMDRPELRVLDLISYQSIIISGDSFGVIRMTENTYASFPDENGCPRPATSNLTSQSTQNPIQAHESEITAITSTQHHTEGTLIATGSRDRTVQIFRFAATTKVSLSQTMVNHSSSITDVMFLRNGESLLTSSSDRTIGVYMLSETETGVAFSLLRIITLKSTPICISVPVPNSDCVFLVSCADKYIYKYDLSSALQIQSTRPLDRNGEPVVLGHISIQTCQIKGRNHTILVGISGAEKAVRLHDYLSGHELVHINAHVGGAMCYALIQTKDEEDCFKQTLVTAGLDSTIMLWSLRGQSTDTKDDPSCYTSLSGPTPARPLWRILSRSTLAVCSKSSGPKTFASLPSSPTRINSPSKLRKATPYSILATSSGNGPRDRSLANVQALRPYDYTAPSPISQGDSSTQCDLKNGTEQQNALNITHDLQVADLDAEIQELCMRLSTLRVEISRSSEILRTEAITNLKKELKLTLSILHMPHYRLEESKEMGVDLLLDMYSEHLVRLVEDKMSAGLTPSKDMMHVVSGVTDGEDRDLEGDHKRPKQEA